MNCEEYNRAMDEIRERHLKQLNTLSEIIIEEYSKHILEGEVKAVFEALEERNEYNICIKSANTGIFLLLEPTDHGLCMLSLLNDKEPLDYTSYVCIKHRDRLFAFINIFLSIKSCEKMKQFYNLIYNKYE